MAYNLNNKLVIAISSRALFDLEEENQIFEKDGLDAYYKYQLENEDKSLKKGTGYRLVENILKINSFFSSDERQVEVIILSKNNAATSLRITNAINDLKLDIIRSAWTSGTNISNYLKAFKVDLFLSADDNDVLNAIENGVAAAKILPSNENIHNSSNNQVRRSFAKGPISSGLSLFNFSCSIKASNPLFLYINSDSSLNKTASPSKAILT
jgi:5'-nucleotidase